MNQWNIQIISNIKESSKLHFVFGASTSHMCSQIHSSGSLHHTANADYSRIFSSFIVKLWLSQVGQVSLHSKKKVLISLWDETNCSSVHHYWHDMMVTFFNNQFNPQRSGETCPHHSLKLKLTIQNILSRHLHLTNPPKCWVYYHRKQCQLSSSGFMFTVETLRLMSISSPDPGQEGKYVKWFLQAKKHPCFTATQSCVSAS